MKFLLPTAPSLLGFTLLLLVALARGHDTDSAEPFEMPSSSRPDVADSIPATTYFQLKDHSMLMFAHIVLATIAWVFILPIAVMFSIARSRFALLSQFIFVLANSTAVFLVTIYNARTPDLYPNNSHHKLGWWLTWIVFMQIFMSVVWRYSDSKIQRLEAASEELNSFIPVSTAAMAEHQRMHDARASPCRFSNDSGQGTERNTESLRSQSISSIGAEDMTLHGIHRDFENERLDSAEIGDFVGKSRMDRFLPRRLRGSLSSSIRAAFVLLYSITDRIILLLAFVALATGAVTYGGLFMGDEVYNGLAHFIKGGVFLWYGILTLGRWAGCFSEIGWAWNMKPSRSPKVYRPSAEFLESFLIFLYGSTNVFLEHLAAWGGEWTAQDLEHISITIMFFGGGLCGMFVESGKIRDLLNASIPQQKVLEQPKSYKFSMNPLPALIVLLLGLMMSSHHQQSMISSMIHKQWGTLLVGAAFARASTYIIFYLAPPTSIFPSRPPSELITAFCLMAGGLVFMASSKDTVDVIEFYKLDAMFVFTVSMGIITFLMAWIILVIAIKGWAITKEKEFVCVY